MMTVYRVVVAMSIPAICCVGVALGKEVAVELATVLSTPSQVDIPHRKYSKNEIL